MFEEFDFNERPESMLSEVNGIYALTQRQMHEYLLGITKFAFIDESEQFVFFLLDHFVIMGLFVFVSHYISTGLKRRKEGDVHYAG